MTTGIKDPYIIAAGKLIGEGFAFDAKTCFFERDAERLKLTWNGRVYARRRGPPKPLDFAAAPESTMRSGGIA